MNIRGCFLVALGLVCSLGAFVQAIGTPIQAADLRASRPTVSVTMAWTQRPKTPTPGVEDTHLELNSLGVVYYMQGRYARALEAFQRALEIAHEVEDKATEGAILNNIALIYGELGRYGEALGISQQALAIARKAVDRRTEAAALANIGRIYCNQGRFAEALETLQRALNIVCEAAGDRADEAAVLNLIGLIYQRLGRYEEASETLQRAFDIAHKVGSSAVEAATLNNLGLVYKAQGHSTQALEAYQQALVIVRELRNPAWEGITLHNIGGIYEDQGRYVEALDIYQQSLAIRRKVGDRLGEAATLNSIGLVYDGQGRYEEALDIYQQARTVQHEVGDRTGEGVTLINIGIFHQRQGKLNQALFYYEQAMSVVESVRAVAGSEQARASFIAQYADMYNRAVGLHYQQGEEAKAFHTSERGRARAFLDSLATGDVVLSDDTATELLAREREAYAFRQAALDALARARAVNLSDPALVADLEAQLTEAEEEYAAVLAAIEERGDQLAALVPGRSTVLELSDVQALLDEQTTLVSYHVLGDEGALAFVITRGSFSVVQLPQATPDNLLTALVDLYKWLNRENPHPLPLRDLHAWLVAPLAGFLRTPLVGIIPHLGLHYVPFAALTDGKTYFGQQHTLFTLPSASALPFIQDNAVTTPGSGALVFGSPETRDPDLRPLVHAAAEAEAVAELLEVPVYIGADASEIRLWSDVGGVGVVHLATHGKYNVFNPLYSAIHLAPGGEHDGRLEVHEVYGLDLAAADLVVLSACQTNIGELSAGDEVVGLTRALFFAGTPTVIASLWPVDDAATEELMVAFYRHWQAGKSKAEALQAAQAEVRETHPGPFYWAAFVLSGDPGVGPVTLVPTPMPPFGGNILFYVLAGALLLVLGLIALMWARRLRRG